MSQVVDQACLQEFFLLHGFGMMGIGHSEVTADSVDGGDKPLGNVYDGVSIKGGICEHVGCHSW